MAYVDRGGKFVGLSDIAEVVPELQVSGVELTPTSLSFPPNAFLDKDVWLEVGKRIFTAHSAVQWWIGDWLKEGEVFYFDTEGGTVHYAQLDGTVVDYTYKGQDVRSPETEALNLVAGYSRDTLLEFKRVARIFDKPIRIGTLRWGHHQVAAALPTAEARLEALEVADRNKMSVANFRVYVRRFYPNGTYTPTPDWRRANDRGPSPTPDTARAPSPATDSALSDALNFIDGLSAKITQDAEVEVFYRRLIEDLQKRLAAAREGAVIPATGALPRVDVYIDYLARGKKYAIEVLVPGGMKASKGTTVTGKLKKYFLAAAGTDDLLKITVPQWEAIWATLDAVAKEGNQKAVAAVEAKVCRSKK
jgi:hypothetical protein